MAKDRPAYPSETADKYVVRFPNGMRDLIARAAKLNRRTMNAEIVARLAESLVLNDYNELAETDETGEFHARLLAHERSTIGKNEIAELTARLAAVEEIARALYERGEITQPGVSATVRRKTKRD